MNDFPFNFYNVTFGKKNARLIVKARVQFFNTISLNPARHIYFLFLRVKSPKRPSRLRMDYMLAWHWERG